MTDTATDRNIAPLNETALRNIVEILRTGDYQQARGALRVDEPDGTSMFCCLGVMCDVLHPGEWADGTLVDLCDGNIIENHYALVEMGDMKVWKLNDDDSDGMYREKYIETHMTGTARRIMPSDNDAGAGLFTLPRSVQLELGITASGDIHVERAIRELPDDIPEYMSLGYMSLASMNDGGATFDDIADVIEYVLDHPDIMHFTPVRMTAGEEAALAS